MEFLASVLDIYSILCRVRATKSVSVVGMVPPEVASYSVKKYLRLRRAAAIPGENTGEKSIVVADEELTTIRGHGDKGGWGN